jgi:thiol-disulfide isomerase/thioredoxin
LAQPYRAAELRGLTQWFNSPELKLSELHGKVVLIDFWTYSCINCIRTLPHITGWDAKYRKDGLVIIGLHAPEFEFEKKPANVAKALKKYGILYPVALDNQLATWSAFNNSYWPAHYLIDKSGRVVYTHFGEGNYDVTEMNIQRLLGTTAPIVQASGQGLNFLQSPETYLGLDRTANFSSPQGFQDSGTFTYPQSLSGNHWALSGDWRMDRQFSEALQANAGLRYQFNGKKVHLVMGSSDGKAIEVQVLLNRKAQGLPITVQDHRLYTLLSLPQSQTGLLEIKALRQGLEVYAFTFGS